MAVRWKNGQRQNAQHKRAVKPTVKQSVKRVAVKQVVVKPVSAKPVAAKQSLKRGKSAGVKKAFVLDDGLRKLIRKEAAELKMSEEEFLRLLVHFSEVMRTSIVPAGLLDGGLLQMLLANPMAMGMLKNVIGNMFSRFGGGGNNSATSNAAPGSALPGGRSGNPSGGMGMGNPMMQQRMPGAMGGMPWMGQQARAGQMGNPMGNMMYGMNGPAMNPNGPRPMQGAPGMGMNQGQGQSSGGGGLSNLFNMDNLTNMFSQFFGNQSAT